MDAESTHSTVTPHAYLQHILPTPRRHHVDHIVHVERSEAVVRVPGTSEHSKVLTTTAAAAVTDSTTVWDMCVELIRNNIQDRVHQQRCLNYMKQKCISSTNGTIACAEWYRLLNTLNIGHVNERETPAATPEAAGSSKRKDSASHSSSLGSGSHAQLSLGAYGQKMERTSGIMPGNDAARTRSAWPASRGKLMFAVVCSEDSYNWGCKLGVIAMLIAMIFATLATYCFLSGMCSAKQKSECM